MSGWVPLDKALIRELPKDRPYTRLEAMFSLTCDYDNGETATLRGYASLWRWSTGKVERFLKEIGVRLEYPETTGKKTNQRGTIMSTKPRQSRDNDGTINFIDSRALSDKARQRRDNDETAARQSQGPTIEPKNLEPKKKPSSPEAVRLSGVLADMILQNNPGNTTLNNGKREATVKKWAADIDKLIRIDGKTAGEIERVIRWCQADFFWKSNILSGAKLREKWNQLVVQMQGNGKAGPPITIDGEPRKLRVAL